jgi:signal transduction histidine kinase
MEQYVRLLFFPFTDVDGSPMILEVDIDITERVNLEKQLMDKERLVTIGATAGMVGHDIRNPLQAIAGDLCLSKSDLAAMPECEEKEGLKESLVEIEKNVEYIEKLFRAFRILPGRLGLLGRKRILRSFVRKFCLGTGFQRMWMLLVRWRRVQRGCLLILI